MYQYSLCAFLAPALVSAAAFPWAGPEPTLIVPEQDRWSPKPTAPPAVGGLELFRRAEGDNTCGYISGESTRSLTCNNDQYVCATNSYYGVHGCCDPAGIETCTMPTSCIPSSELTGFTSAASSSDDGLVASCTDSAQPYCYQWLYVYASTVMTEFGCAESAFTISVERTMSGGTTSEPEDSAVPSEVTTSSSSSSRPESTDASTTATSGASSATTSSASATEGASDEVKKNATNVGAIAGGVVGGVLGIGAIAFGIVFFVLRSRRNKQNAANAASGASQPFIPGQGPAPGVTEYKPQGGYPSPQPYGAAPAPGYYNPQVHEQKQQWPQQGVPGQEYGQPMYSPPGSPNPPYPGPVPMGPSAVPQGIAEAGGSEVHQPVPASAKPQPGPQGQTGPPGQGGPVYEAP